MRFVKLVCGSEDRTAQAQVAEDGTVSYPAWTCDDIATVSFLDLKTGNHHMLFTFGSLGSESAAEAFNATKVWDGGGSNAYWSNPLNWSGDTVPTTTDYVVFDGSCASNCNPVMDVNIYVSGFTMTATTTATFTASTTASTTIDILGDFTQNAGTFGTNGIQHRIIQMTIGGNFNLGGGTFYSPDIIRLSGNFNHSGGTFANNYTAKPITPTYTYERLFSYPALILDGSDQTISGNNTFGSLIKIVRATSTLTFAAGSTQTVLSDLELKGIKGAQLRLRSTSPGTPWNLVPRNQNLAGLDIQDSNNTTGIQLCAHGTGFVDSGNNTNWSFNNSLPSCTADPDFPVVDGIVYQTAKNSQTLFVNGEISYMGPNTGYAATLDKSTLSLSGSYPKIENGGVSTIISDGSGGWYLGGDFTKADSEYRVGLIHVLSSGALDTSFNARMIMGDWVNALLLDGSTLYVGGKFNSIGGKERFGVAALDAITGSATNWNASSDGVRLGWYNPSDSYPSHQEVNALALNDAKTTLYVAGTFYHIGGRNRNSIAALDTTTGSAANWPATVWGRATSIVVNGSVVYFAGDGSFGANVPGGTNGYIIGVNASTGSTYALWASLTGVPAGESAKIFKYGNTLYYTGDFNFSYTNEGVVAIDISSSTRVSLTAWNAGLAKSRIYDATIDGTDLYLVGKFWPAVSSMGYYTWDYSLAKIDLNTGVVTATSALTSSIITAIGISGSTAYLGLGSLKPNSVTGSANAPIYLNKGHSLPSVGGKKRNSIGSINLATKQVTDWNPNPPSQGWVSTNDMAADENYVYLGLYSAATLGGIAKNNFTVLSATGTGAAISGYPDADSGVYTIRPAGDSIYLSGDFSQIGTSSVFGIAKLLKPNTPTTTANCSVTAQDLDESFESGPGLPAGWTSGGNGTWAATTSLATAGTQSLALRLTSTWQVGYVSTTVNLPAEARLSFDWRINGTSSLFHPARMLFCLDNESCDVTTATYVRKDVNIWNTSIITIPAGSHTITWKLYLDGNTPIPQTLYLDAVKIGQYSVIPCRRMRDTYLQDWGNLHLLNIYNYDILPDATRNQAYVYGNFTISWDDTPADYVLAVDMTEGTQSAWRENFSATSTFGGYNERLAKAGNNLFLAGQITVGGTEVVAINIDPDTGNLKNWSAPFDQASYPYAMVVRADTNHVMIGGDLTSSSDANWMGFASLNTNTAANSGWAPGIDMDYYWPPYDQVYNPLIYDIQNEGNETVVAGDFGSTSGYMDPYYGIGGSPTPFLASFDNPSISTPDIQLQSTSFSAQQSSGVANITLALSATTTVDTQVQYQISDGSATQGEDYTWSMGLAGIDAGQTTSTIAVPLNTNSVNSGPKTFTVNLTSPSGAVLGANTTGTVTITTAAASPGTTFTLNGGTLDVTDPGVTDSYTVVLDSQPTNNVTVAINTTGQATTSTSTLVFTTANWNTPQTVTVSALSGAVGNSTAQINHTFTSSDSNYNGLSTSALSVAVTGSAAASTPASSGGSVYAGSFAVTINNAAASTTDKIVSITLAYDIAAAKIKISNLENFSDKTEFAATGTIADWDLCQGVHPCKEGRKAVYVQFYSETGTYLGAASGHIDYQPKKDKSDASTPDAGAANDPVWQPDFTENAALEQESYFQLCSQFNSRPGWFGKYYSYPSTHSDMELPSSLWQKDLGDPLSKKGKWASDWYSNKYFRFAKTTPDLKFGTHYFPFDYAPQEFTQGHKYYFGTVYSSQLTAKTSGNYDIRISSDDDAWVYLDGKLVIDNHGVHGASTKTDKIKLKGSHFIQVFFAERHTTNSHLFFEIIDPDSQITYTALQPDCQQETETPALPPADNNTEPQPPTSSSSLPSVTEQPNTGSGTGNPVTGGETGKNNETTNSSQGLVLDAISSIADSAIYIYTAAYDITAAFMEKISASKPVQNTIINLSALTVLPLSAIASQGVTPAAIINGTSSLVDIRFWLLKLIQWLQSLLGLRRKKRYWGTVYDSQSKQPLDPVMVELFDATTGKKLEQAITDISGRYGFLANQGHFRITAQKTHYQFPSQKISGNNDQIFDNLYYGTEFNLDANTVIAPNIPMDPLGFDWNQMDKQRIVKFHPLREQLLELVLNSLFWAGFAWGVLVLILQPSFWHWLVMLSYAAIALAQLFWPKPRLWGRIFAKNTKECLNGLILELNHPQLPVTIAKAKTNFEGKYFLKAAPGNYALHIFRQDQENKTQIAALNISINKEGIFNQNLGI